MVEYNENINYYLYNYFFNNEKYLSLIYHNVKSIDIRFKREIKFTID